MRRKVLQDIANTLCQMVVGWRMGDDYERIADMPDGTLVFDLLAAKVDHNLVEAPQLWIAGELNAWLLSRLVVEHIPVEAIVSASLVVEYKTDRIKTNRKKIVSFDFVCRSTIETSDKNYTGNLIERHAYHQRVAA